MGAAVGAAERIVGLLADAGVRRLYGWAGEGSCLDLIEAARARDIPLVAPRLLASAAIMAATEGDLLGRPGVCVAPRAAWAAVPGLAHANAGHSPLLFLFSGQPRGVHAESDERFERALRAVAKAGTEITGSRVERALLWAWRKSNQYPQGPVYLGIGPRACARFSEDDAPLTFRVPIKPSPSGIRRIARVLAGAGRAVLVAGTGCRTPRVRLRWWIAQSTWALRSLPHDAPRGPFRKITPSLRACFLEAVGNTPCWRARIARLRSAWTRPD